MLKKVSMTSHTIWFFGMCLSLLAQPAFTANDAEKLVLELDPGNFDEHSITIDNEWWPLKPGTRLIYEGSHVEEGEEIPHRVVDTVTDLTKVINGVRVLVSLEEDFSDGEMIEQEIAFHAQDKDGNVWHLGQLRETYDEVEFVGGRVWFLGYPKGAKAGIRMPAKPHLGAPAHSQGYAPAPFNWTDRARVFQMGQVTRVAAGRYEDVMVMEEWDGETPEGVFQLKYYAKGVGTEANLRKAVEVQTQSKRNWNWSK